MICQYFCKADFESRNISTDFQLKDNIIINDQFDYRILDHPMKPLGIRYWDYHEPYRFEHEFLQYISPQACSWLRDQEYLVDFKYYYDLENGGYLHIFPKVR